MASRDVCLESAAATRDPAEREGDDGRAKAPPSPPTVAPPKLGPRMQTADADRPFPALLHCFSAAAPASLPCRCGDALLLACPPPLFPRRKMTGDCKRPASAETDAPPGASPAAGRAEGALHRRPRPRALRDLCWAVVVALALLFVALSRPSPAAAAAAAADARLGAAGVASAGGGGGIAGASVSSSAAAASTASSGSEPFSGEAEILFPGTPPADTDGARTPRSVRLMPDPWLDALDFYAAGGVGGGEAQEEPELQDSALQLPQWRRGREVAGGALGFSGVLPARPASQPLPGRTRLSEGESLLPLRLAVGANTPVSGGVSAGSALQQLLPRGVERLREQLRQIQLERLGAGAGSASSGSEAAAASAEEAEAQQAPQDERPPLAEREFPAPPRQGLAEHEFSSAPLSASDFSSGDGSVGSVSAQVAAGRSAAEGRLPSPPLHRESETPSASWNSGGAARSAGGEKGKDLLQQRPQATEDFYQVFAENARDSDPGALSKKTAGASSSSVQTPAREGAGGRRGGRRGGNSRCGSGVSSPEFNLLSAQSRCQMRLKDAIEAAARGALIPELRAFVDSRAEPPPILPLFLGGPLPPIPMVLPKAASILPGDMLEAVLRTGQLRVGVLASDFLPADVRHFGPDEILTGLAASVLERAVAIVSHNYSVQLQKRPVLVQYLVYSSRAALYAALLREDVHLTDLATPYSGAVAPNVLPSARLHAALAPLQRRVSPPPPAQKHHQQARRPSPGGGVAAAGEGEGKVGRGGVATAAAKTEATPGESASAASCQSAFVWGSPQFFADVVAGDAWAAVPVLSTSLRVENIGGNLSAVAARAFRLCEKTATSSVRILVEAAVPELADLAAASLPACADFALVRLSGATLSEASALLEALDAQLEAAEAEESAAALREGLGVLEEEAAFAWNSGLLEGETLRGRAGATASSQAGLAERMASDDGTASMEVLDREEGAAASAAPSGGAGIVLPGEVPLFSLAEALAELRSRRALAMLHVTPLAEVFEGRSVLTAAPWLLETDSDLVLPLAAFFKRPQGPRCVPLDPQLEFENVAAVAKRAAAQAFARQMRQDEEL